MAFSPRKQNITLYIMEANTDDPELLKKLGKYKTSGVCLHIQKLSDVDLNILETLVKKSFIHSKK